MSHLRLIARSAFTEPDLDVPTCLEHAAAFRSPHLWKNLTDGWELRHIVE
jgi:hypothetical protein